MGHQCFYIAGLCDRPVDRSAVIPEAHFKHPTIDAVNRQCFGSGSRSLELTRRIHETTWRIKQQLHAAIERLQLDVLIAENCLTIPLNVPLGIALVETMIETGLACIVHHHDFVWERERFSVSSLEDYIHFAFPPALARFQHVVINSKASREFSRHAGLSCRIIPNVMDFDQPPPPPDEYARDFRTTIGVGDDDLLILQPTRVVPRKGIEHSIELVRQLNDPRCKLVISHSSGDEGEAYAEHLREFSRLMNVEVVFADRWISTRRGTNSHGEKQYTLWDAYPHADFVTYPSLYEGFGNALLEAVYFKQPMLCNRYGIYRTDIEPCGFQVVLMDGFLTRDVVQQTRRVLTDAAHRQRVVDHNYDVARRYFSFRRLEAELRAILAKPQFDTRRAG
jgi:glycosyltransferase involved in cell wall biosynthesis